MNEIIDHLFISGIDALVDQSLLITNQIKRVVSVGVELPPHLHETKLYKNVAFLNILDSPDVSLVSTIRKCLPFIDEGLNQGECVLVHCVYGQSRSVSVVASFLMLCRNFTVNSALELIKLKRPGICINPGFLCQLMCMSSSHGLNTSYLRLIEWNESRIFNGEIKENRATWGYHCKSCQHLLFTCEDLINDLSFETHLDTHLDSFWRGFRSTFAKKPSVLPIPAHNVVAPLPWIIWQISVKIPSVSSCSRLSDDNGDASVKRPRVDQPPSTNNSNNGSTVDNSLRCPSCKVLCGYFEKKGLLLCSGHMVVDLFAISNASSRKKRIIYN